MPTTGDFAEYLAKINWFLAVVTAAAAIAVAALAKRFLEPAADHLVEIAGEARDWTARVVLRRRHEAATTRWTCPRCRSINQAAATLCYRGCGPRPVAPATVPADGVDERAVQRGGRTSRRG